MSAPDVCALRVVPIATAEELLNELNPHTGTRWNHPYANEWEWIYRGQASGTWNLTPSALRPNAFERFKPGWMARPWLDGDPQEQRDVEESVVMAFATRVDFQGLPVPGDRPELRERMLAHRANEAWDFARVEYRGMYALAQHHGVPTRLLDWTKDPRVAAYFACVRVAEAKATGSSCEDSFAVWALARGFVDSACRKWNPSISVITVPTVSNPNLHAQKGIFTVVGFQRADDFKDRRLPDLDEVLLDESIRFSTRQRRQLPVLFKYVVPSSEARTLLRYLALGGVSAASVFPNHGGAVEALREARWYQRAPAADRR